VRARFGDRIKRVAELLQPLRRRGRGDGSANCSRGGLPRLHRRRDDSARLPPQHGDCDTDDERHDQFDWHVRWLF